MNWNISTNTQAGSRLRMSVRLVGGKEPAEMVAGCGTEICLFLFYILINCTVKETLKCKLFEKADFVE